jgi:hypothetical protein
MKIEGGKIVINVYDLIGQLPAENRADIIDALACQDEVIDEVVNQVLDGWTTVGSHAGTTGGGSADAVRGLDGARMRIAKSASDVAAKEIAALAERIERERQLGQKGWDAYHELLRSRSGGY